MLRNLKVPHKSSEIFLGNPTDIQSIHESCPHQMPVHAARSTLRRADGMPFQTGRGHLTAKVFTGICFPPHPTLHVADGPGPGCRCGYLKSRIPSDGPYTLTMDRTNWKFGEVNINALVPRATARSYVVSPSCSDCCPRGKTPSARNSRSISCSGSSACSIVSGIKCLVADREFVGYE